MDPADDFVEDFVGADRALKRLALMRVARRRPLGGAARLRRPGDRRGAGEARGRRGPPRRCWSTPSAGRSAGSPSATSTQETVPAKPDTSARPDPRRATTSCATRSPTCSRPRRMYAPVVDAQRPASPGVLSVEIISDFLDLARGEGRGAPRGRAAARRCLTPRRSSPLLAQVEIRDRTDRTTSCVADERHLLLRAGPSTTSTATSTPTLEHLVLVGGLGRGSAS